MLNVGQKAPVFELPDAEMEMVNLAAFRGRKKVVLFFYAHDRMPQCTKEAIQFSDHEEAFIEQGAVVLGISRDDVMCHADFCETHGLSAHLLSDPEGEVCQRYGVLHEKDQGDGHTRIMVDRITYVIDREGVVRHVVPAHDGRDHVTEVLKLVKEI